MASTEEAYFCCCLHGERSAFLDQDVVRREVGPEPRDPGGSQARRVHGALYPRQPGFGKPGYFPAAQWKIRRHKVKIRGRAQHARIASGAFHWISMPAAVACASSAIAVWACGDERRPGPAGRGMVDDLAPRAADRRPSDRVGACAARSARARRITGSKNNPGGADRQASPPASGGVARPVPIRSRNAPAASVDREAQTGYLERQDASVTQSVWRTSKGAVRSLAPPPEPASELPVLAPELLVAGFRWRRGSAEEIAPLHDLLACNRHVRHLWGRAKGQSRGG